MHFTLNLAPELNMYNYHADTGSKMLGAKFNKTKPIAVLKSLYQSFLIISGQQNSVISGLTIKNNDR